MCDLYGMNADGTDVQRLTDVGTVSWGGSWSPDGPWIAVSVWVYVGTDVTATVAFVPVEGGVPRVVASDGYAPSWRP